MRLIAIGLALALAAGAASSAAAQGGSAPPGNPQGGMGGMGGTGRGTPPPPPRGAPGDDRLAEFDGRLSEIGGNLRLNPDQQKLWAAVEDGARGVVRQRFEAQAVAREQVAAQREARNAGQRPPPRNVPEVLRMRADASAGAAEAIRRLAEATAPLFETLDDRQRQRFGQIIPAIAQAGRRAAPEARRGPPPRRGPAAQQPQGPDDDMDDDEPAGGMAPPPRSR